MASPSKKARKPGKAKAAARSPRRKAETLLDQVVRESAARFACSQETAEDSAIQCEEALDVLDAELPLHSAAAEIWASQPRAVVLVAALDELGEARNRYQDVLVRLVDHFAAMATEDAPHLHLEPASALEAIVRAHLLESLAPETMEPSEPVQLFLKPGGDHSP